MMDRGASLLCVHIITCAHKCKVFFAWQAKLIQKNNACVNRVHDYNECIVKSQSKQSSDFFR